MFLVRRQYVEAMYCGDLGTRISKVGLVKDPCPRCPCSWRIGFGESWRENPNHLPCSSHESRHQVSIDQRVGFRQDDKCSHRESEKFQKGMP